MATPIKSQAELYQLFINALATGAAQLTDFNEGSINDSLGGATSLTATEMQKLILDQFAKAFFNSANGPEVTGGPDDLQTLAVDHFGQAFARPLATAAIGTVTFSRPTAAAGNVLIPAGTIVKTTPDASGNTQRFATQADVTIIGLTINASITAIVAGSAGSAGAGAVSVVESSLLDQTITVSNAVALTPGTDTMNDSDYREFIRNKIESLRNGTLSAIEGAAKTVPGVVTATAIEAIQTVIPFNIATGLPVPGAAWFNVVQATLYVADVNGNASTALIAAVIAAITPIRAGGVNVAVKGASALAVNWTATYVLNPLGPNYAALSQSNQLIVQAMSAYIQSLAVGTAFIRATGNAAILAQFGPAGTNDLTSFTTSLPVADVQPTATQKLIPGVMATV